MSARLSWPLRWRLSVLWALEWAITGAILTYLPVYFTENNLSFEQIGRLMAVSAVGLWVAPLVVGQVCDRWMSSEKYLAISHFVGGMTLISIPIATEMFQKTGANFSSLMFLVGLYAVAYFPTIALASSLTFRHLPDPDSQFGKVRIWGTVGWVLAGLSLSLWLGRREAYVWAMENLPALGNWIQGLRSAFSWVSPPSSSDSFRIAAMLSFALASFCVFLPPTPPERSARRAIAPLQVLSMFRDRTFSLLIAISFLLAAVVPFYSLGVPKLLKEMGYDSNWVPALMTIGQISEFPALLLLPFCLKKIGLKSTFAFGMAAWFIRYVFFAVEDSSWLILLGIGLHGVCHVFLIVVLQLYIDGKSSSDIRASAQNVFTFLTMGIAMPIGFVLGGKLGGLCFNKVTGKTNYQVFFSTPAAVVLILICIYWRWFQHHPTPNPPHTCEPSPEEEMAIISTKDEK